jgi:hypothetical protein
MLPCSRLDSITDWGLHLSVTVSPTSDESARVVIFRTARGLDYILNSQSRRNTLAAVQRKLNFGQHFSASLTWLVCSGLPSLSQLLWTLSPLVRVRLDLRCGW